MTLSDLLDMSNRLFAAARTARDDGNTALHLRLAEASQLLASAMRFVRPAPDLHGNRECAEVA